MLRAVGMTRRQMRRMVRHESIITALLGALIGMAAGLGLAAIVTAVFADAGLAFVVPVGTLVAFTVVAVAGRRARGRRARPGARRSSTRSRRSPTSEPPGPLGRTVMVTGLPRPRRSGRLAVHDGRALLP